MLYKSESPFGIKDVRDVEGHITRINRAVQNVFSSLDPEDNFSKDELMRYEETKRFVSMLEISSKGFTTKIEESAKKIMSEILMEGEKIGFLVDKGHVAHCINLYGGALSINGERLEINTKNFVLTEDRAIARGEIHATGGEIAGWKIHTSGKNSTWTGGASSRIRANTVIADYGYGKTINAYGDVVINATFKGNFEDINVRGAKFIGGFSCSAMESGDRLTCGNMRIHTTKRGYGEKIPTDEKMKAKRVTAKWWKENRDGEDKPRSMASCNYSDEPEGGLVVSGNITCKRVRSMFANSTWSDARLKEHIRPIESRESLVLLGNLFPKSFTFIKSGNHSTGFIAQEVPSRFVKEIRDGYLGLSMDSISCCLDKTLKDLGEAYGRNDKN